MKKLNELILKSSRIATINKVEKFDDNIKLKFTARKIAFKIFYELKNKNLTQQDLAKLLKVTPQNVSKLLKGDDYKISTLLKLEEALSISLIDREIFNNNKNISVFIDLKSFEQKTKPLFVSQTTLLNNDFRPSKDFLILEGYNRTTNFQQSSNKYF